MYKSAQLVFVIMHLLVTDLERKNLDQNKFKMLNSPYTPD